MMRSRFEHLRRDERGMSFVWVGMGFMTFFAASTLAIDVGMYMTARSQAQNAADAGALAGATALVFNDYYDRSAGWPRGPQRNNHGGIQSRDRATPSPCRRETSPSRSGRLVWPTGCR